MLGAMLRFTDSLGALLETSLGVKTPCFSKSNWKIPPHLPTPFFNRSSQDVAYPIDKHGGDQVREGRHRGRGIDSLDCWGYIDEGWSWIDENKARFVPSPELLFLKKPERTSVGRVKPTIGFESLDCWAFIS